MHYIHFVFDPVAKWLVESVAEQLGCGLDASVATL